MVQQVNLQKMSAEQFFPWLENQEKKYELVDGYPVMMASASQDHNDIVTAGLTEFALQLRGKPCRPIGSDSAIHIPDGNIRFPDFGVDCGQRNGKSMVTSEPAVVVEVLSPSTRFLDFNKKLDEYKRISALNYILLVEQDAPCVHLFEQLEDRQWKTSSLEGLDATVKMPVLELSLSLAALYERVQFPFRPTLIEPVADSS